MSMHRIPLTDIERKGLERHGLGRDTGKPSQLADVFRQGVKWGQKLEREACAKVCDEIESQNFDTNEGGYARDCADAIRARGKHE